MIPSQKRTKRPAPVIRNAHPEEAALLLEIERSAAQIFRHIPTLSCIADGAVLPAETHLACIAAGTCWVATNGNDEPVAFLSAETHMEELHVLEMSVSENEQGKGIGKALIQTVCGWAKEQHLKTVTLTTFREPLWNAPFYIRMGFEILSENQVNTRLSAILQKESESGFVAHSRCAMRLFLAGFHSS